MNPLSTTERLVFQEVARYLRAFADHLDAELQRPPGPPLQPTDGSLLHTAFVIAFAGIATAVAPNLDVTPRNLLANAICSCREHLGDNTVIRPKT